MPWRALSHSSRKDQEIGHLLPVRPLVELPDGVGADLAGRGQDPKEIPPRRWSERVSEASRILPKTPGRERISGLAKASRTSSSLPLAREEKRASC
jgi:hypothetical protein